MCLIIMCEKYKGGKFMKKLWYCVGGEYHKKILRNARNFSFEILYDGQLNLST